MFTAAMFPWFLRTSSSVDGSNTAVNVAGAVLAAGALTTSSLLLTTVSAVLALGSKVSRAGPSQPASSRMGSSRLDRGRRVRKRFVAQRKNKRKMMRTVQLLCLWRFVYLQTEFFGY